MAGAVGGERGRGGGRRELVHAATLVHVQREVAGLHGDVVAGGALVARVRGLEVAGAGAAMAQHAAALYQPLGLVVGWLGERQHGEVEALHALDGELLELVEAEVARVVSRVRARRLARVVARARLQLDGLGVVAEMARGDQHARRLAVV